MSENSIERDLGKQTNPKGSKWWLSWKSVDFLL